MEAEKIKLKFTSNHASYKIGSVVSFELKAAKFYMNLGVAQICECSDNAKADNCEECEKAADMELASAAPEVKEKKAKKVKK